MTYLGFDPGANGAVAAITNTPPADGDYRMFPHGGRWVVLAKFRLEKLKGKQVLDSRWLFQLTSELAGLDGAFAGVEHQHARAIMRGPRRVDTPTTAFALGQSFGMLCQNLVCCGVSYDVFEPQVWQKGIGVGADKEAAFGACHRLFPSVSLIPLGGRVEHDGMADALLICEYARRVYEGKT